VAEKLNTSETSVNFYQTSRSNNPEDSRRFRFCVVAGEEEYIGDGTPCLSTSEPLSAPRTPSD
jgi:hypothetical protein